MIAIIGKSGSGKSFLLKQLQNLGYKTFDCDQYVNFLYQAPNQGYQRIKKHLGKNFVNAKEVNKEALKQWLWLKPQNLKILEALVHELVFTKISNGNYEIVEIAKIDSSACDFRSLFKKVIYLSTPEEQRIHFLNSRNVNKSSKLLYAVINNTSKAHYDVNISYEERQKANFLNSFVKNHLN